MATPMTSRIDEDAGGTFLNGVNTNDKVLNLKIRFSIGRWFMVLEYATSDIKYS